MRLHLALSLTVLLIARSAMADEPGADAAKGDAAKADVAKTDASAKAAADELTLVVHSNETVRIENADTGEVVCTSPCEKSVPAHARYRIGGFRPSPDFVLKPGKSGRSDIRVKPAHASTYWLGVGALGLGGALLGAGIGVLIHGVNTRPEVQGGDGTETDNTYTDTMAAGTGLAILGVVSAIYGGATMVSNYSTKVRGDLTPSRGETPPRTGSSTGPFVFPRATTFPILQASF